MAAPPPRGPPPASPSPASIVGREAERESIAALIDDAGEGPRALLVEGEAGLGKTTLWRWGVDRATHRGLRVLSTHPAETEQSLPFAALGDVLAPIVDETVPVLPSQHRVALEAVLARVDPGEPVGKLAVGRGVLGALQNASNESPFVIAIDDAQWLDSSSAAALEFAIRRLGDLPARLLLTRRRDTGPLPLGLDGAIRPEHLIRISLDPLLVGELDELLRHRIGLTLRRPQLLELHRMTAGNPFYALEIGRAALKDSPGVANELVVPESLGELLRRRLAGLSGAATDAVLLAAATEHPTAPIIEHATGKQGLAEAVKEGILQLTGERVVFAHPLLASVAYRSAMPWERRAAHALLAAATEDALTSARHLALATEDPDEGVAAELDRAALRAHRLGAPAAAAELAAHACRLTPESEAEKLLERMAESAEYHLAAGDSTRGRELLEHVVASRPAGPERARILLRLGRARYVGEDVDEAHRLFERARMEAGDDEWLRAEAEQALAFLVVITGGIVAAATHARSSLDLAERLDDPGLLALALGRVASTEFLEGKGLDRERMDRAVRLEDHVGDVPVEWRPSYVYASVAMWADDLETPRTLFERLHRSAVEQGDERAMAIVAFAMSQLECAAGNWSLAARDAAEAVERSRQSGLATLQTNALSAQAMVSALLGNVDGARAAAEEGIRIANQVGAVPALSWHMAALGFLELSLGDHEAAHGRLAPLSQMIVAIGLDEPGVVRFVPDDIEALVALGELDAAREPLLLLEERGRALDRVWARAAAGRCRALLEAAEGNFDPARESLSEALAQHDRLEQPFELGRTLLVQGTIERRAKRRGVARGSLTAALEIFDSLGAPLWADKATAELARIPGRVPASGELTETERRIAELVAVGLSNKDIAAKLFVTVRTVEANLTRIYGKLGVHSRTELARELDRLTS